MEVVKIVFSILIMLLSAYIVSGFIAGALQELKHCSWITQRRKPMKRLTDEKNVKVLVTLKTGEVKVSEYSFEDGEFKDEGVIAWRILPKPYRKSWKKWM